MKVVIFAGGYGTRLSEETAVLPKPLVEIGSMPMLWHIMKIYAAYGLTDYVYGADVEGARRVGRRLRTGGVGINTSRRYEHAPFGGVGDSGIGREGGLFSLEACTVRRAYVLVDPSQDIL